MRAHLIAAVTCAAVLVPGIVPASGAAPVTPVKPVTAGTYEGYLLDPDTGEPTPAETIRFKVRKDGKRVVKFVADISVVCYSYPNTYTSLPVVVKAPDAKVKNRKADWSWTEDYVVDGETYTLTGLVQLRFSQGKKVTGQLSVDFANCATRTGDAPYWVPVRAQRT